MISSTSNLRLIIIRFKGLVSVQDFLFCILYGLVQQIMLGSIQKDSFFCDLLNLSSESMAEVSKRTFYQSDCNERILFLGCGAYNFNVCKIC